MPRLFQYKCDFCGQSEVLQTNSTKPFDWTNVEIHTRPALGQESGSGDIKRGFLICDKCTEKLINVIANWT